MANLQKNCEVCTAVITGFTQESLDNTYAAHLRKLHNKVATSNSFKQPESKPAKKARKKSKKE